MPLLTVWESPWRLQRKEHTEAAGVFETNRECECGFATNQNCADKTVFLEKLLSAKPPEQSRKLRSIKGPGGPQLDEAAPLQCPPSKQAAAVV